MTGGEPGGIWIETLGCRTNRAESAAIAAASGLPFAPAPGSASLLVVNTCAVTARAERDSRRAVRRLRRWNPRARLVCTGCAAECSPEAWRALPGVDTVLGNDAKPADAPPAFLDSTRAFLKIQDGCDSRCAYCIIPRLRGPSRSEPPDRILARIGALREGGHPECVLTGISCGDYGKNVPGGWTLARLAREAAAAIAPGRIRLSSVEPTAVTEDLVEAIAGTPGLCPHIQVPLQSGSDRVLAAMRRPYRAHDYREIVERLADRVPGIAIGADVLVGFPGETGEDFEATRRLVETLPLATLHVFSYSPRPGTPPATLPERTITERARALRTLGVEKKRRFALSQAGTVRPAILLREPGRDGRPRALTDNFLEVPVEGPLPDATAGSAIHPLRIACTAGGTLRGTFLAS